MEIEFAEISDAPIIHELMFKAFMEYKNEVPPSSALEETVESITSALIEDEKSLIAFVDNESVGMVRFKFKEEGLYFYRLSVIPEKQGQGIAKKLLASLEEYAHKNEFSTILCKVRMNVPKNIQLYSSIGYSIYDEEVVHKPNSINIQVVSMQKKLWFFKKWVQEFNKGLLRQPFYHIRLTGRLVEQENENPFLTHVAFDPYLDIKKSHGRKFQP